MRLQSLPAAARRYVQTAIGLGTPTLVGALATSHVPWSPALFGAMGVAAVLASQKLLLVGTPGAPDGRTHRMSTLSLGFPIVLGSILWFGAAGGALVGVASGVGASLYPRRHPLCRAWFTVVNLGLTAMATGILMSDLGSVGGPARLAAAPLGFVGATLLYYLLNTGMVCVAVALSHGTCPWAT